MSRRSIIDDEITVIKAAEDIGPGDSVSQTNRSTTSSTASQRIKLAAKAAALKEEAGTMEKRHELEIEERNLMQRREKLELETQLAIVNAEAEVYQLENASRVSPSHVGVTTNAHEASTSAVPVVVQGSTALNPLAPEWPRDTGGDTVTRHRQLLAAIHVPHATLMNFDGNPLEYWAFIISFQNSVERVCEDDISRLTRLLQYCTGKAKRVIQCCSIMEPSEGYAKAQQLLKERFGNNYVIAEAWLTN